MRCRFNDRELRPLFSRSSVDLELRDAPPVRPPPRRAALVAMREDDEETDLYDIVAYCGRQTSECGYCASNASSSVSDGAVAHRLTTKTYNDLIEDGWRRSGRWLYKPAIGTTCCAQHTIRLRCDAFTPSKSQRKVLKRLEAFLEKAEGEDGEDGRAAKTFEITTARSTFDAEEFALWKRYQVSVHGDEESDLSARSYVRFLVDSPFEHEPAARPGTPSEGYGAFHQQYRIDGALVAVGVVDILPRGLSSKYFFWDPDYAHLSLGKVSALKEIEYVLDQKRRGASAFEFYYMGYYIHDCQKMKYKAEYAPSELRCSTTNRWVRIEDARARLDAGEHARLSAAAPLERRVCPVDESRVALTRRGELVFVAPLNQLQLVGPALSSLTRDAMARLSRTQAEWCERSGPAGANVMNVFELAAI